MEDILLGVKMCGNCNPDIESMALARRIAGILGGQVVPYGQGQITLTISACGSACVEEAYPAHAVIRGLCLNGRPCRNEDSLAFETAALLQIKMKEFMR